MELVELRFKNLKNTSSRSVKINNRDMQLWWADVPTLHSQRMYRTGVPSKSIQNPGSFKTNQSCQSRANLFPSMLYTWSNQLQPYLMSSITSSPTKSCSTSLPFYCLLLCIASSSRQARLHHCRSAQPPKHLEAGIWISLTTHISKEPRPP